MRKLTGKGATVTTHIGRYPPTWVQLDRVPGTRVLGYEAAPPPRRGRARADPSASQARSSKCAGLAAGHLPWYSGSTTTSSSSGNWPECNPFRTRVLFCDGSLQLTAEPAWHWQHPAGKSRYRTRGSDGQARRVADAEPEPEPDSDSRGP
eukprot:1712492-Rhodomonas_salina.5